MNETHVALTVIARMKREYWEWRLKRQARSDAASPRPGGAIYRGVVRIAQAAVSALHAYPYEAVETRSAKALAYIAGLAMLSAIPLLGLSLTSVAITAGCFAAAMLGVHHGWFKRGLPARVTAQHITDANRQLDASGDRFAAPLSLIEIVCIGGLLAIDGFISGGALSNSAFSAIFTPNIALAASVAWGLATAFLLWHAAHAAATEVTVNERRTLARKLEASPDPKDQARFRELDATVGPRLLHDYSARANTRIARYTLAAIVLTLALAIFAVRLGTVSQPQEDNGSVAAPLPNPEQPAEVLVAPSENGIKVMPMPQLGLGPRYE
jgi:hypothetical protein